MKTLEECRKEIDEIDEQMMALFAKRMAVAKDVVTYKMAHDMEIFQPDREKLVVEKNVARLQEESLKKYGEKYIQAVMDISKDYQSEFLKETFIFDIHPSLKADPNIKVGYQGVEGAFGQEALEQYFSSSVQVVHFDRFEDVFKALEASQIDYGIVPIENSSTGAVNDVYDLIRNYGLYIVGEQSISVAQHLLGHKETSLNDIKEVYSHPQALAQTSKFFSQYPHIQTYPYANTAMAAKMVSESDDKTKAAIASKKAAELYHLEIIQDNIHNDKTSHTRFIVISKHFENQKENDRISILCSLKHEVGSLSTILNIIKDHHLNMVHIESRPVQNKPWEYYFYIDFEGNVEEDNVQKVLNKMMHRTQELRILGTYKQS